MCPEKATVVIYDHVIEDSSLIKKTLTNEGHVVLGTSQCIGGLEKILRMALEADTIPDVVILNNFAPFLEEHKGEIIEGSVRRICGDGPVTVAFTNSPDRKKPYGQYQLFKSDEAIEKIGKYVNALPGKNKTRLAE